MEEFGHALLRATKQRVPYSAVGGEVDLALGVVEVEDTLECRLQEGCGTRHKDAQHHHWVVCSLGPKKRLFYIQ